ncbi:MAG TPA: histidinol dehydrogenase [Solirubrobacteraceae bacterium]|nr:histidinol dehydrogenase [Solirubrobacteraceae bacterium]
MRVERVRLEDAGGAPAAAAAVRALAPAAASVAEPVREVIERVRAEGDRAVEELTRRFDTGGAPPWPLRADPLELRSALERLAPGVRSGLELAAGNVRAVALAGLGRAERTVELPQGQRIVVREFPVRRAGIYVPGGRAPYPSTAVMGVVTAQAAGVEEVVVCAPPGRDGQAQPVILAACALCGIEEVYRMGGAQAVAALALGTETVAGVDVIAGPGNLYVQEAKRQLSGVVGIDGFAGPSDLLVLLAGTGLPDANLLALDLLAQGEHGPESLVVAVSEADGELAALAQRLEELAARRPTSDPAACVLVAAPDLEAALAFAEAFAPEHLQLAGPAAEALAPRVRAAGCVFVGPESGTAFGDYVAGSNHVLPTAGAARFASGLWPGHFRRRLAEVHVGAADELAPAGAAIARAEGFLVHAESMEARIGDNGRDD